MNRPTFFLALALLTILGADAAEAGLPPPNRSSCGLSAPPVGCQYRFRADGAFDVLTVFVTLRDDFDAPVPGCETSVTINLLGPPPGGGDCGHLPSPGAELCSCCPLSRTEVSGPDGTFEVTFSRLGGRGRAEVCVTALCIPGGGQLAICCEEFVFTSPDLDGSCETSGSSTSVVDFGIWAACFPPGGACRASDYNCDCQVDILDLALYAGGLLKHCGGADCP